MSTQQLHQGLVEDGFYSKTFQQFQSDFSGKEKQLELYDGIVSDGDFSGSFLDFQNKFFPTQVAVTTPTSTTTKTRTRTTPKVDIYDQSQIEQNAVNKTFWDTYQGGQFNREDFRKNKDCKWEKRGTGSKEGEWISIPQQDQVSKDSGLYNVYNELNEEEIRIGESITKFKETSVSTELSERDKLVKKLQVTKKQKERSIIEAKIAAIDDKEEDAETVKRKTKGRDIVEKNLNIGNEVLKMDDDDLNKKY